MHVIILGSFPGSATVSLAKPMNFQDVSPNSFRNGHTVPIRSTARRAVRAKPGTAIKADSLHLNGGSEVNPLREIAEALTCARQCKEPEADELLNLEFPFQIKGYTLSDRHNSLLQDGQNRLAGSELFAGAAAPCRRQAGRAG